MILTRLLAVLVFLSLGVALAEGQSHQMQNSSPSVSKPDAAVPQPLPNYRSHSNGTRRRVPVLNSESDETCYTMRTYLVQRDNGQSDSVHPVGYTSCLPASHVEIKVTIQPIENDGDRR
jgi:hypothetical protein